MNLKSPMLQSQSLWVHFPVLMLLMPTESTLCVSFGSTSVSFILDLRGIFNIDEECSVVLCAKCVYYLYGIFDHDFHIFRHERFWILTLHKYVH